MFYLNVFRQDLKLFDEFLLFYEKNSKAFLKRLDEFQTNWQDRILEELIFCLCTPQTSPFKASLASISLTKLVQEGKNISCEIAEKVLRNSSAYVRFHKTKSVRIVEAQKVLPKIKEFLLSGYSPKKKREFLSSLINGFSFKETSHFLRNIGRRGLAIIDRHMIRFLTQINVIEHGFKLTKKNYLLTEDKIKSLCCHHSLDFDAFDIAVFMFQTGFFLK
ncbi:MAG: hypothetical protein N2654_03820 [Deltaproteobacteria bacterium]|nr:hypothetical protein [Deltaproteobacteria bacterium]